MRPIFRLVPRLSFLINTCTQIYIMHLKQSALAIKRRMQKEKMKPPSKISLLSLFIAAICLAPFCSALREVKSPPLELTYHNGPLLKGNVSLSLLWYGTFQPIEKTVIRSFIQSIGSKGSSSLKPDVGSWWKQVESYLATANALRKEKKSPPSSSSEKIMVKIEREVDENTTLGYTISMKNLPIFLEKAKANGPPVDICVVLISKEIDMAEMCDSSCYVHGILGKQLYIVVHNPEHECPGRCAIPFHQSDIKVGPPVPLAFEPPSRNMGADATLINFAKALAEAVTNPSNSGFYAESTLKTGQKTTIGAAKACPGLFAKGGFPGYPGNIRIDPNSGGAFNVHGVNGTKFLLPALWDPKTSSCWTVL